MYKPGLEKAEELEIRLPIFHWIMEKEREFQKNIYFCFIEYSQAFYSVDHNKLPKILEETRVSNHLTEKPVCGSKLDVKQWTSSKQGKEFEKAVYCHPAYLAYMQSSSWEMAVLDESQAGTKISGSNVNNLRYADDTTLMAESEEELKSLLMRVKEESKITGLMLII